ncbi:glycosyltransferase family 39 protein [Kitasatospora sp. MMS16-BH015]|uniref:ArnT family glycosyltransferase n=1 Tax=Kitasatospora sp. MMS16-BH015 TaxID=2018025 RepID=UPI0020C2A1CF|nr:glycosyltransferase family 39 protein [Kitasatospora sp. MMS16-BH015]
MAGVAAGVVVLLLALAGRYGYHRDELYFLLAGRHLAWGYVDQPPLTPWLARLSELALGDSPLALRVLPALLAGVDVVLVALLAREFGGERRGQLLAAWATAGSAFVLATGHLLLTSSADLPASLGVLLLGLRLLRTGDGRWWLPLGAATGLALLNKDLVLLIGLALLAAVLVSGPRRALLSRWLPAGLALAVLVALPNLLWEAAHGWPQLTVANGITDKDGEQNRWLLLPLQLVLLSPAVVPLVLRGARRLRREPELSWARAYPLAYPLLLWLLSRFGGKAYYAVPLLLVLMAAGCAKPRGTGRVVTAGLLVGALVNVVITLPVLPPKALVAVGWIYPEAAEQVGWPQLASAAARGWAQIPPEQRDTAVLFAANYGEAGALARYGPGLGLPGPYSGHMSLADWGPPADRQAGPVLLVHPAGFGAVERQFTDCRPVGEVDTGQGVANQEQHAAVVLCAGPSRPWSQLWPQLRHYY